MSIDQGKLRFASSYRQLLSSPLPQTAKATPHFGNHHVLPSLRCGSARLYGQTYHEPLTFTLLREGYKRLPCPYISHPSGAQVARGAGSFPIPIRSIQNTHSILNRNGFCLPSHSCESLPSLTRSSSSTYHFLISNQRIRESSRRPNSYSHRLCSRHVSLQKKRHRLS
jgi:hypothetical protein